MFLASNWETFIIVLTQNCNFRCNFCKVGKNEDVLALSSVKKIINFFLTLRGEEKIKIKLHGGEPLLCWNKISYLINKFSSDVNFLITTNGWFLDKNKIEFLKSNRGKFELVISIDEQKWKKEDEKKLFAKLNLLLKNGILDTCAFNFTLTPFHQDRLVVLIKRIKEMGAFDLRFFPSFYMFWKKTDLERLSFFFNHIVRILDNSFALHLNFPRKKEELCAYFSRVSSVSRIPLIGDNLTIDSKGDVYPSDFFLLTLFEKYKKYFFLGNISDPNLKWQNKISFLKKNPFFLKDILMQTRKIYKIALSDEIIAINDNLMNIYKNFINQRVKKIMTALKDRGK